jgi:MATE family multidrug resistance protein
MNAESILLRLGQEPNIARLAGLYLRWFTLCIPGQIISVVTRYNIHLFIASTLHMLLFSIRRYLQAQGIMHAQTIVMIFVAPANLFFNWFLVWGPSPFRLG